MMTRNDIIENDESPEFPDDLYCEECGQPCSGEYVDFGIGPYEFWGQKGVDKNEQYVSNCCEAPVLLYGSQYVPDDPRDEYNPEVHDDDAW